MSGASQGRFRSKLKPVRNLHERSVDMAATRPLAASSDRAEPLAARYERIRRASLALAAPLAPEDQVVQVMPETSPTKWHLAHVTWFFERFCLVEHVPGYEPV